MRITVSPIRTLLWILASTAVSAPIAAAGEIYGRVGNNGKVFTNAAVTITCPGFNDTQTTNSSGAYRSPGPSGEQQCRISVSGASNSVPVITSQGRTRVNLEVKGNRLYRR